MVKILGLNCLITRSPVVARVGRPYRLAVSEGQHSTSGGQKKAIFQSDYSLVHAVVTLLYRKPRPTAHVVNGYRQQHCIPKIAVKPLHIETWLLLAAYRHSTVPSPILYDVRFSHNTCVTDDRRQTDRRRIVPKTRPNNLPKANAEMT